MWMRNVFRSFYLKFFPPQHGDVMNQPQQQPQPTNEVDHSPPQQGQNEACSSSPPLLLSSSPSQCLCHDAQNFSTSEEEEKRYDELLKKCMIEGRKFFDKEFKIYVNRQCKRASDCKDFQMNLNNITLGDAIQGEIQNCWLISVISSLVKDPERIRKIIKKYSVEWGIYLLCFYRDRAQVHVIIDDHFQYDHSGNIKYAHGKNNTITWASIIEKGYAKLRGSYEKLNYGNCLSSFIDLTGGFATRIDLKLRTPQERILTSLISHYEHGYPICSNTKDVVSSPGLIKSHAYTVLGVYRASQGRPPLVKLRDPLGVYKCEGGLSLDSQWWESIDTETKERVGYFSAMTSTGQFFMRFDDFMKNFSAVTVFCNDTENVGHKVVRGTWWSGSTMGGTSRSVTWTDNPQYAITASSGGTIRFEVSKKGEPGNDNSHISARLYSLNGREPYRIISPIDRPEDGWGKCIHKENHTTAREVAFSVNVDKSWFPLVIVPTVAEKTNPMGFIVSVFADKSANLSIEKVKEWKYHKSVTCSQIREYGATKCPQCALNIPFHAVGQEILHFVFRVFTEQDRGAQFTLFIKENDKLVLSHPKQKGEESLVIPLKLAPGNTYYVTLKPEDTGYKGFTIFIYSNMCDFDLREC